MKDDEVKARRGSLPATLDSKVLLQGADRVIIKHSGECYCLRVTRNEKLILTKV